MRPLSTFVPLFALLAATPVAAQMPINGLGNAGGAEAQQVRRWLARNDDRPERVHNGHRRAELAGRIGQLRERIRDLRETGQISRAEARAMRREARALASSWAVYSRGGLSDSEAGELDGRIGAAMSLALPSRPPAGR